MKVLGDVEKQTDAFSVDLEKLCPTYDPFSRCNNSQFQNFCQAQSVRGFADRDRQSSPESKRASGDLYCITTVFVLESVSKLPYQIFVLKECVELKLKEHNCQITSDCSW
jgi:hypothetical protein